MSKAKIDKLIGRIDNKLKADNNNLVPSLMVGRLGVLFFLFENGRNQEYQMEEELGVILKELQKNDEVNHAFGFSGFGWTLQYLIDKDLIEHQSIETLLNQLDELSYKSTLTYIENNNTDFMFGALGCANYLIPREKYKANKQQYFKRIIDHMFDVSLNSKKSIYWKDNEPNIFYEHAEESITLGLAHGQASKIVFFSKLLTAKIETQKSKSILIKSVNFLRTCQFSTNEISVFPLYCVDGKPSGASRLAWCHGDLGIGVALYQAGIALQDSDIINEAIEICVATTKRKLPADTDIVDAGLCHGISGVLTMYNIMYENTGLKVFFESAEYWLNELLKRVDKNGLAGLDAWDNVNKKWVKDDGLLNGLAGIGLALLSHKSRDFEWSSCLLLK